MGQITLTEPTFKKAIEDAIQIGKEAERDRIIKALNEDAVFSINVDARLITYIVEMIENV